MRKQVAPTRSNLLKLTDELKFATLGRDLLDQKRSILVVELLTLVDQAVDYQSKVDRALEKAQNSIQKTV
ncbi:MAG: V-type ATP synthase subunit D, partial [Spirochaetales bacterium]|nr:V-type ATP synthase subunit D [Spirochaetales bacterium]